MKVRVPLLYANVLNSNDRIYTEDVIKNAMKDYQEKIDNGQAFGELGYPDMSNANSVIALNNASHKVVDMEYVDNTLFATIEFLETPAGEQALKMLGNVVFRPRAFGRVNADKTVVIDEIISFDAIHKDDDSFKDLI